ncbi:hypothetical protein Pmar_PMAR021844 [Perkinsus marinus ATCC 50983]|uniref:Heparan-alpha-glucosaminide N-acetyltransferase catalytic domain-containing protein n=1 Tax=Perkinsus marinus (strain ATCC 50983 / TXsc) TaxID=423536 RepID=C5LG82_PERM5|nr:hypothetical protein Pmar_PMAR021844 [Perkinsus marinus ATCC 50983]EER04337.1 hypothetical protein Pmar_PMAR021844 [Perkinsus marinus ATCC 50983]|eukprot:XP_002772521.1 hypothetical protein Pmar_PMAR021844 [Perkinsus marinus ATCC 50983]
MHKGTSKGFERVSNVENGGAAADDEYDGDREEPQGKKSRYIFMPRTPIYFGAIHCITLNTLLTMIFIRVPRIALVGFVYIQFFTMMGGVFPLEIPTNRPTVDVIPWFHNLGYCLLGVWLHSVGAHKISAIELIPGRSVHFEDTVFTFFGRHDVSEFMIPTPGLLR